MQNIARELHKSVKNKERGANLHKSVIGDIWIRSIFAIKSRNKRNYVNIVFIKQHDHTLMLNLSKQLRITLLRSEKKYYLYNIERQEMLSASHDDDSKIIIRQYI